MDVINTSAQDRPKPGVDVTFETVDPESAPARDAMDRYFAELGRRLAPGLRPTGQAAADSATLRAPHGAFVVAVNNGVPVGCGGVRTLADGVAEIKRMWVDPGWRGVGLGSRLLRHLECLAAGLGHRVVRLDTNETLTEAIAMYRKHGYRDIERYNDNPYARCWFEKQLPSGGVQR